MSLKKEALSGLIWTFSQQFGSQIITFIIGVVVARLLLPSDFGTIAMFGVVMSIGKSLADGGMASSLIRTKETNDEDFSTVFWFNIAVAMGIYGIIFMTAPFIAEFYTLELLTPIIRVYCLVLVINSFITVQHTRFVKEMKFKVLFTIQLPSLIISGIAGVIFAYYGFGVWSLVYSALIQSLLSTIQYWFYGKWRPLFIFNKQKFKHHFGFGFKLTLSGLLDTVFKDIYTIIIGKVFSPGQLGYYNRADNLKQLPITNLSVALNRVTYPLFSKIQNDDVQLKNVYKKIMKAVIFVVAPILMIMCVLAEPLIRFILTEKWLPVAPYLQILCIVGLFYPIHSYNLNILKIKGRSDLFLKLEVIKKILIVVVVLVSVNYGIFGLLWGRVFTTIAALFINMYYSGKFIDYKAFEQLKDILPTIVLAVCVGLFIYLVDTFLWRSDIEIVRLTIMGMVALGTYILLGKMLKFSEFDFIRNLIRKK